VIDRCLVLVSMLAVLVACGDATEPRPDPASPSDTIRAEEDLRFLRTAPDAPPLERTTASFYAVRGDNSEIRMYYQPRPGDDSGDEFLRFEVRGESLRQRPDGTPIAEGDSVLITLTVIDPERLIVDFQPAGLRFNAEEPARLRMSYAETVDDRDDDGDVDDEDRAAESSLSIWRRERPDDPWIRIGSLRSTDVDEIEADISGFTYYAIAY
jgi:hypothetical protein